MSRERVIDNNAAAKEEYNDLPEARQQEFMKDFYNVKSYIQKNYGADSINLKETSYTGRLRKYFESTIKQRLNIDFDELENVHKGVGEDLTTYDFDFGINSITKALYEMDEEFTSIYHEFIRKWVNDNVAKGRKFWFQKTPTIRVHCPGANSATVYPAYHSDIFLGHHPYELNIWIPLTYKKEEGHGFTLMDVEESRKILEPYNFNIPQYYKEVRDHGSEAFRTTHETARPVDTEFGEILLFDLRSIHSTIPMTQQTRVSIDVRIIFADDKERHPFAHKGLGRMKKPFEPGEYYFEECVN